MLTVPIPSFRARPLALMAGTTLYILQYLRWRFGRSRPKGVQFVAHWFYGSVIDLMQAVSTFKLHDLFLNFRLRYGHTYAIYPPFPMQEWTLVTSDPKNVEHILKTNFDNYPKGWKLTMHFRDLLGSGIFNIDGSEWYKQRKIASHMFKARLLKDHIWFAVQRNAHKLRSLLIATNPDEQVDVFNLINRFTLDTIGEIGFGKCIGSLDDPTSPFLKSFDRAQQISVMRICNPLWILMRWLGIGFEREMAEHIRHLDAYSRTVVRELQASCGRHDCGNGWSKDDPGRPLHDTGTQTNFMGLFIANAMQQGTRVDEDYLRDLVLNFLIAGRDTTAQALSWTLFCLCTHPAAASRVRQEISNTCRGSDPAFDDINTRLPYLHATLSEALRLYPSVPIDLKVALCDDVWPDGTVVPAGTHCAYDIYSMGRDPQQWGADAAAFRPERWLEMQSAPDNYHYPVFNGGPRECLGRRLALIEVKTCLAMLLPKLEFRLAVPASYICPGTQLTIGMGHGLPCFVSSK